VTHVGQQLVDSLVAFGIRHIFGCPGGQSLPLYNGIANRPGQISHVLMHDERSAVYAADGYTRASGTVGVCDATVGPGASNLVSGLVEAFSSSVPLLAIVSDIPRRWEHYREFGGASQAFQQHRFLEGCVKYLGRVEQPENLAEMLSACLRTATSGRPGPVVLEIPDDIFAGEAAAGTAEFSGGNGFYRLRPGADPAAVKAAADMIRASVMPVIVAGGGAAFGEACKEVVALAELLRCPVVTTISGKGVIPEDHPLSAGVVGRFGVPMANWVLGSADCAIFVGSKAGQSTTLDYSIPRPGAGVIHIDIDPAEIGRVFGDSIGIFADAGIGAGALRAALADGNHRSDWDIDRLAQVREEWWSGPIRYQEEPKPGIVKPQEIVRSMSELMREVDFLVADASLSSGWAASRWKAVGPGRRFFAPRGLAGLGWGLPAAIGVATAQLDAAEQAGKVVSLAGDGAWSYSMAEVETAARTGLATVSVILNNSTLGWIRHTRAARYPGDMVSQDFLDVSYADAAAAMGAAAESADDISKFRHLFAAALADRSGKPWVIEVTSCATESPVQKGAAPASSIQGGY
jgi:acetolactate synthase I/II/III large subunit